MPNWANGGEPPKDHALVSVIAEMLPPLAEMVHPEAQAAFSDLAGALSAHCDVQGRSLGV